MGVGDNIMASGMAKGAAARGVRIAFGDRQQIKWDGNSEIVFRGNPNVAHKGEERRRDIEWIEFYKGHRVYNKDCRTHWKWNYEFKAQAGEMFLTEEEKAFGIPFAGAIIIEPNIPREKQAATNKKWRTDRYDRVAELLRADDHEVIQFVHDRATRERLKHARQVPTKDFRQAYAVMLKAALYIGPEGGLHHAAAAACKPAVVLFGGFVPPEVLGYDGHVNLVGNSTEACGSFRPCNHCGSAMSAISVEEVYTAARKFL